MCFIYAEFKLIAIDFQFLIKKLKFDGNANEQTGKFSLESSKSDLHQTYYSTFLKSGIERTKIDLAVY